MQYIVDLYTAIFLSQDLLTCPLQAEVRPGFRLEAELRAALAAVPAASVPFAHWPVL